MDASFQTALFVKGTKAYFFFFWQKYVGCFEGRIGGSEAAVGGVSEFTSSPADGKREL